MENEIKQGLDSVAEAINNVSCGECELDKIATAIAQAFWTGGNSTGVNVADAIWHVGKALMHIARAIEDRDAQSVTL